MKKFALLLTALTAICALTACSGGRAQLLVASQANVNPDFSGRPSPVVVKVYELRRGLAFRQADFQNLFDQPMQTLGADILAADELVFVPGEARSITYLPGPDARFLGIVAGFRQMDRARWRTLRPIDAEGKNLIALELNDASIIVIPESRAKDWDPEEALKQHEPEPEPELPAARTAVRTEPSPDQTLTSYEDETPPAPPRPVPETDPDVLERNRRMPSEDMDAAPGMSEPEETNAAGKAAGTSDTRPRSRRAAPAPYAVPPMKTAR